MIEEHYRSLVLVEPKFEAVIAKQGYIDPFAWDVGGRTGDSHFASLVLHIVGQQISTKVAFAIFDRLASAIGEVPTAPKILELTPEELRALGLSMSKLRYITSLAQAQVDKTIDLEHMDGLSDQEAVAMLTAQPGIGLWTAEMFLIFQLHRSDILPAGDVGIRKGIQRLFGLETMPDIAQTQALGEPWSPYRTYASTLLWRAHK